MKIKGSMRRYGLVAHVGELFAFLRRMGVVPTFFILSIGCSLLAVLFNLIGLSLLIPLITGIVKGDFMNVHDQYGIVVHMIRFAPEWFATPQSYFILLVVTIFSAIVAKNSLEYLGILSVSYEALKSDRNIRKLLFERYLSFGKMYYDQVHLGTVNHVLMSASLTVSSQLRMFQQFLSKLILLLAYVGIMAWISWKLTLLVVTIFPFFMWSTQWLVGWMKKTSRRYELARGNLHQRTFNLVLCMPLVKAHAAEETEKELFLRASDEELRLEFEMEKKNQLIRPIEEINSMLALLVLAMAMTWLTPIGQGGNGSAYLLFLYVLRWSVPLFGGLNGFLVRMARVRGALDLVRDALKDEGKFIVKSGNREFQGLLHGIQIKNLVFAYRPDRPVLKGISLNIPKGGMTAVVGPTGSGKTTLINLILRFYDCPPGSIFMDAMDIREYSVKSLMRFMGVVGQDVLLFNESVRFNMTYGLERSFTDEELLDAARKARLDEFIRGLPKGLHTVIGERGIQLSGGERQRLSIARVFLKEPDILLLDEATNSLDSLTERLIQEAVDNAIQGRTALVIAHRLSTISHADQIIVLDHGSVVEQGSLQNLLAQKGKFWQYWEAQKFSVEENRSRGL
ncbi:MAG: ABC transporter ATP-binding protein [Candidatus Omnitrophica bacterium]|nr:ABC transporter ATP-binding protein [Candidatus Omnitrophota bacterium]